MASYPTGVEIHGGNLRLWFIYKGKRVRENLGVPDTAKNRKIAGELRTSICYAIKTGTFDYSEQFPNPNFVANQMGHASAQMIYNVYGKWMSENNLDQIGILNSKFSEYAPPMPQGVKVVNKSHY